MPVHHLVGTIFTSSLIFPKTITDAVERVPTTISRDAKPVPVMTSQA